MLSASGSALRERDGCLAHACQRLRLTKCQGSWSSLSKSFYTPEYSLLKNASKLLKENMLTSVFLNFDYIKKYLPKSLRKAKSPQGLINILIPYPVASAIAKNCTVRDVVSLSLSCKLVYNIMDSHGFDLLKNTAIGCSVNCSQTQPEILLQDIARSFHRCHFCSRRGCHRPGQYESTKRCLTEFRCSRVRRENETPTTLAQHPPSFVCNQCLEERVPEPLRPQKPDSASHSHLDGLLCSNGIICHRHPRSTTMNPPDPATDLMEKACQEYHDLFGAMEDPNASVDEWVVKCANFQERYYTELKRHYRNDWGHNMPALAETRVRRLLDQNFSGLFLCI
ncbi:hypothetical protein BJX63DRAFT_392158 [Aspergillus granulosus]|uniref:F-box domain-containing protein n=1 Tax=Aspergillus granulosus TaxID=176169 RepID=A0ABR4HH66_9EURO